MRVIFILTWMASAVCAQQHAKLKSPDCDACRTIVEQFYKGWETTITGLAANGTFESQPGKAPKIVYNQHIEDYLQGFCDSKWMKGYADYIGDGCKRIMKEHHRPIVGKFLHEEEKMGTQGKRTTRPHRTLSICKDMVKACPHWPSNATEVKGKADRCKACRGVVNDALYILRRSRLGGLSPAALKKKRLELFEMYDNICPEVYYRHRDEPEVYDEVCQEMWEDEDVVMGAFMKGASDMEVARSLCAETLSVCSSADFASKKPEL